MSEKDDSPPEPDDEPWWERYSIADEPDEADGDDEPVRPTRRGLFGALTKAARDELAKRAQGRDL